MKLFDQHHGHQPVLISIPHDGGWIPEDIAGKLRPEFRQTPDRDWHVSRLYDWAVQSGYSVILSRVSRYVVDLNRPPDNTPLYPGAPTPGICPTTDFTGRPLYQADQEPDAKAIRRRISDYWQPYHQAIENELQRLQKQHGQVLLWDAHSIRSRVPALFSGRLPDFNLGTYHGQSCTPALQAIAVRHLRQYRPHSVAINGRFIGGHITRHYGQPEKGIYAMQMEISQRTYLDESNHQPHHGLPATRAMLQSLIHHLTDYLK